MSYVVQRTDTETLEHSRSARGQQHKLNGYYREVAPGTRHVWGWWVLELADPPAAHTSLHLTLTPKDRPRTRRPIHELHADAFQEWWTILHWIVTTYRLDHYGIVLQEGTSTWNIAVGTLPVADRTGRASLPIA